MASFVPGGRAIVRKIFGGHEGDKGFHEMYASVGIQRERGIPSSFQPEDSAKRSSSGDQFRLHEFLGANISHFSFKSANVHYGKSIYFTKFSK